MTVAARTSASVAELDYRPSYLAASIAGAAVFVLYLLTLAPTTSMWDTSEYITAAYTLGLPHPPGNPLFVLIGRVFAILPIAPTVAMRINVLAAVASAVSAGLLVSGDRTRAGGLVSAALAAHCRWCVVRADWFDGIHGVESVCRQREGVHSIVAGAWPQFAG